MSDEPTKAYYVERISRAVTTVLVHAANAEDAKRRATQHGVEDGSESEFRGWGRITRAEMYDGRPLPSNDPFSFTPDPAVAAAIKAEEALAEKLGDYEGEWVAVRDHVLVDHAPDLASLVGRVGATADVFCVEGLPARRPGGPRNP